MLNLFRAAPSAPDSLPPLSIAGRTIPVELRRAPRARRLTLRADSVQGVVRVTVPPRTTATTVRDFLARHEGWVAARVAGWPAAQPFAPGGMVSVEGHDHRIDWAADHPRRVAIAEGAIRVGGPAESVPARVERALRAHALAVLAEESREFAALVGKGVTRVSVRDTASRWGSCSASGAIAYSWRLILMPAEVRRSIVAHEVAHLVHLNHGPDFHALADRLYPHHASARRWLKRHGASVHWVGRAS